MITLTEAFKLLNIENEMIYFRNYKSKISFESCGFWSEYVKKFFNMKKIHVIKIEKHFTYDNSDYYEFLVNLSYKEILEAERKIQIKQYSVK